MISAMSVRHPIIAITGSSGAGTTSVMRTFEQIFRREGVQAAFVEGDSFHRYDRAAPEEAVGGKQRPGAGIGQSRGHRPRAVAGEERQNDAADLGDGLQPVVGYGHAAFIGLDRAEGIVRRLRSLRFGQRIEKGGFSDVGQANDAAFETHGDDWLIFRG